MDKFIEKIKKAKSKINLSAERSEDLYLKIIARAVEQKNKVTAKPVVFWGISARTPAVIFAGFLGFMVITASTSFASEGALPGDILYPIKRNVNENVLKFFAKTTQEKVQLESSLVERRLSEATQLASLGRLTKDMSDSLGGDIEKSTEEAKTQISLLREEGGVEVAISEVSRLETALRANGAVLRGVIDKKEKEEPAVIAGLGGRIELMASKAGESRISMEDSIPSAGASLFMAAKIVMPNQDVEVIKKDDQREASARAYTEKSIVETSKSIERFKETTKEREKETNYSSSTVNEVIKDAETDMENAKKSLERNDIRNSLILINQSGRKVREAEIINDAEKKLNVKVFEMRREEDKNRESSSGAGGIDGEGR